MNQIFSVFTYALGLLVIGFFVVIPGAVFELWRRDNAGRKGFGLQQVVYFAIVGYVTHSLWVLSHVPAH